MGKNLLYAKRVGFLRADFKRTLIEDRSGTTNGMLTSTIVIVYTLIDINIPNCL